MNNVYANVPSHSGYTDTEVLIVGAGGSGLAASIFLGDLGVDWVCVERHRSTSHLPKAHYLNQRTMEIFRQHGFADKVYAKAAPRESIGKVRWLTSIGGDGENDRKLISAQPIMGASSLAEMYDGKGATHPTNLPQIRLEPVLRDVCDERYAGRLLFSHELSTFEQTDNYVFAEVTDLASGTVKNFRCKYLLAADAGKTVGPQLGIRMLGETDIADFFTIWFSADLSEYLQHDDAAMRRIWHPDEPDRISSLLTFGPTYFDRHSEEWASSFTRGRRFSKIDPSEPVADDILIKEAFEHLKIDVPATVHKVSRWSLETVIADRMSEGRIFLIGDAAHRHPPGAGLGLNSGFQDAHNIAWKLAMVLRGCAENGLLETYEVERRPVVTDNAEWAINAMTNIFVVLASFGYLPGEPAESTLDRFNVLMSDTAVGAMRRAQMEEVFKIQRVEYAAHDKEMGFTYSCGAIIDDSSAPVARDPMGHVYTPTTRPGSRLPHVWVHKKGDRVSTHDLIPIGGFLLITDEVGSAWCQAAAKVGSELGLLLATVRIGQTREADALDSTGTWAGLSGLQRGGAVLVRPDGHVAYRSPQLAADPTQALRATFAEILGEGLLESAST